MGPMRNPRVTWTNGGPEQRTGVVWKKQPQRELVLNETTQKDMGTGMHEAEARKKDLRWVNKETKKVAKPEKPKLRMDRKDLDQNLVNLPTHHRVAATGHLQVGHLYRLVTPMEYLVHQPGSYPLPVIGNTPGAKVGISIGTPLVPAGTLAVYCGHFRWDEKEWHRDEDKYALVRAVKHVFVVNGTQAIVQDPGLLVEA